MPGLSPKDASLVVLLLISIGAFAAAGRWAGHLSDGRALLFTVGFSVVFTVLAIVSGLAVLR